MPAPQFGRYEVVLEGSVMVEGREIGPPGFRYVRGEADLKTIFAILVAAGLAGGIVFPLCRPFIQEVLHGDDATEAS